MVGCKHPQLASGPIPFDVIKKTYSFGPLEIDKD